MGINASMFSILAQGIKNNKTLNEIDISYNEINSQAIHSIQKFKDSKI